MASGHYKSITIAAQQGNTISAETIVTLLNISITTATPLNLWQHCAQIMLDKGKGHYIEQLLIIQLCKADLNFVLHVLWSKRLIHNAQCHKALNNSQYSLPGMTCQSAVWNKVLLCDLLCHAVDWACIL